MTLRFTLPERPSFSKLTWRRGTLVTTAGVVVALATLVPGTARADTLPAPTPLSTSPGTACPATTPTTIGDGDVYLYAGIPSSAGSSTVNATFDVWNTATSASLEDASLSAGPGTNAVLILRQDALEAAADGAITEFSWDATISDGTNTGPASVTCSFFFDPTRPGNPVITPAASSFTIGTPATFTFTPDTAGSTTAAYTYQFNGGQKTVTAGPDGSASVSLTPTSGFNTLTVTAESPGGNPGGTATFQFGAATPPPAADGDVTGDGIPDLVTVGGTSGVPSGLWVAAGQPSAGGTTGSGHIVTPAVNIGTKGVPFSGDGSASDFDGAQVITGQFMGEGLQDYMVYYPSGQSAGDEVVLAGNGRGSLLGVSSADMTSGYWTSTDPNGDIPLQVANGYHADPNDNPDLPALLTISGDPTHGYYLEYYNSYFEPGIYVSSVPLTTTATPDGSMDWNDWQIATTEDKSGNVDLFLYKASTCDLYLWRDFTIDDTDATASYTQYHVSSKWNPGPISTLRADDINGDGTPDLWTVSPEGRVIGWLVSGLDSKPAITAGHSQPLLSS